MITVRRTSGGSKKPVKKRAGRPTNESVAREMGLDNVKELPDGPSDASGLTPRQRRILEEAGVVVCDSNAQAARLAAYLLKG